MKALDMTRFPLVKRETRRRHLGHPIRPAGRGEGQRKRIKSGPQKSKG